MPRDSWLPSAPLATLQVRRGDHSPVELVETALDRIDRRDDSVNAVVDRYDSCALERARVAATAVESGEELGQLHGLPVVVKDNVAVAGERCTYGAAPLADNVAPEDDLVVERLRDAGAILLGKTNLPEFGSKGVTDNELFGATGTPFAPDRTAGGSSGGSAAAVAAGMATLAVGTDGGGSLRIPASACSVVGVKPTFGRVPIRNRTDAFAHQTPMLSHGPLARTVEGAAAFLEVVSGYHPADPFAVRSRDRDFVGATRRSVDDFTVGYTEDLDGRFRIDPRVGAVFEAAVDSFAETPATVCRASPDLAHGRRELYDCWAAGFDAKLAARVRSLPAEARRADPADGGLDPTTVAAARRVSETNAVEQRRWNRVRTSLFEALRSFFREYDLLLLPTVSVPPFEHGRWAPDEVAGEPVEGVLEWALTWPFNLTGHPAASVPAGFTDSGLPVGLQIVGPRHADDLVLAASAAFERVRPWCYAYDRLE